MAICFFLGFLVFSIFLVGHHQAGHVQFASTIVMICGQLFATGTIFKFISICSLLNCLWSFTFDRAVTFNMLPLFLWIAVFTSVKVIESNDREEREKIEKWSLGIKEFGGQVAAPMEYSFNKFHSTNIKSTHVKFD